jgi:hypothetical protein
MLSPNELKLPDPNAPPFCDGRTWRGGCRKHGTTFVVELFPAGNADYYHYTIYREDKNIMRETDVSLPAAQLKAHLTLALMLEDLHLDDLAWEETTLEALTLAHKDLED